MQYTYTTTKEMDAALTAESANQGNTAAELFNIIVTADMGTLVRNYQDAMKERVFAAYKEAEPKDKAAVDAMVAKMEDAKATEEATLKI